MLQQILSSMHVEPELLRHMDEDDRKILFHKMREEQVRRWEAWEEKLEQEEKARKKPKLLPKPGSKRVQFKLGADGLPWTWVLDDDVKYNSDDEEVTGGPPVQQNSVQSLAVRLDGLMIKSPTTKRKDNQLHRKLSAQNSNGIKNENEEAEDREVQAALSRAKRLALMWEKKEDIGKAEMLKQKQGRLLNNRRIETTENALPEVKRVYALIHNTQKNAADLQNSIRRSIESEESLRERGRTDPETQTQIREIARRAREEIDEMSSPSTIANKNQRNLSTSVTRRETLPITRTKNRPGGPPSQEAIIEWFRNEERPRGAGLEASTYVIAPWFHGMINRKESEVLLMDKAVGTFLVRFCDKIWGYAVSYRALDKCKHYLVDASNGNYQFLGEGAMKFSKLSDLILYYQEHPITPDGNDFLIMACPNCNNEKMNIELFL